MSKSSKSKRYMTRSLAAGQTDLHALAREYEMSLIEMAQWVRRPRNAETLMMLEMLLERRASLLLADARAQAADALRRMATADSPKETARRACIDLLKLQLGKEISARRAANDDEAGADDGQAADLNRLMQEMAPATADEHDDGRTKVAAAQP